VLEAKAAQHRGAIAHRRNAFWDRLSAFMPRMEAEHNGNGNGNGNGKAASRRAASRGTPARAKTNGSDAGTRLEGYLQGSQATILHHLQLPENEGEIDHLVVGPAGITIVDGRYYKRGKAKFEKGQLRIGRHNRTAVVKEVLDQAAAVREMLAKTRYSDVRVEAAIAVGQAGGVPTIGTQDGRRVIVWGTGLIAREASRPGPLSRRRVSNLATRLAAELS
jgi:hypothetical protein